MLQNAEKKFISETLPEELVIRGSYLQKEKLKATIREKLIDKVRLNLE